jgi:hypothetical protein
MTNHRVCNKSNTADTNSGAITALPSRTLEFIHGFLGGKGGGGHVAQSLVFYVVMFCSSLLCPFPFTIALSIFPGFTVFDYPFGIF